MNAGDSHERQGGDDTDASLVSLVLRGDKLPLHGVVSSCYDAANQRLVIVTAPALYLYGQVLELGGELLGMIAAEENAQFERVMVLPWLDAYSVIATTTSGRVEHRIVSADFSECHVTHVIAERGPLFSTITNPIRREVITADADGGFKVWVIRSAGTAGSSSWKGFQRVHAGNRKTNYICLMLASDDQTILAYTETRIHAFDATTCARIGTLFKDPLSKIGRATYDRERNAVYLQLNESRRTVVKLQGSISRGRLQSLETVSTCSGEEDIVAFEAIARGALSANATQLARGGGMVVLDAIGTLVVDCTSVTVDSRVVDCCAISLPIAPSSEPYVAVHVQTLQDESRNFIIVVVTSGATVVEAILTETSVPARRVTTNVAGTAVAMLESDEHRRVAIYNPTPPSLLLFDEDMSDTFFAILLQVPHSNEEDTAARPRGVVVHFTALRGGVLIAWSSGDVAHYCLHSERTRDVGQIDAVPTTTLSLVPSGSVENEWVFVGDDRGAVTMWDVQSNGSITQVCSKSVHSQRVLSMNPIKSESSDASTHLVTIATDGDVKLWRLRKRIEVGMTWELLVCFRSYAASISATALMGREFLFCGSDEGGLECWRVPVVPSSQVLDERSGREHVAVVKHPLHTIDLHLTRVCQVIVEPGDAAVRVSTAHPLLDEFAWVVTFDSDRIVLIWCFSTTFLFPYRRLRPHVAPVGMFMSAVDQSTFRLYAYMGKCLDCIDVAATMDKVAVKKRRSRARNSEKLVDDTKHSTPILTSETRTYAQPLLDEPDSSTAARLRLRITLPTATQADALVDFDVGRRSSPPKMPRTKTDYESVNVPQATKTTDPDAPQLPTSDGTDGRVSSPVIGKTIPELVRCEQPRELKREPTRQPTTRPTSTIAPDTVPSNFQKAKPRVYRMSQRPVTTASQSRFAVVTSTTDVGANTLPPLTNSGIYDVSESRQRLEDDRRHHQDHVAVVTVADDQIAGQLRLDFHSSGSKRRSTVKGAKPSSQQVGENRRSSAQVIEWSSLDNEHQLVELMAATRSRFVVQEAMEDKMAIPTRDEFSSRDVKAQLKVRAFTRWYLSSKRVREAFLAEELRFAAQDAFVNMSMRSCGCVVSPKDHLDDASSPHWIGFALWYATGSPIVRGQRSLSVEDTPKKRSDRLQERVEFLRRRLESLSQAEQAHGPSASSVETRYIFDSIHSTDASRTTADVASWEEQSNECRRLELLLALNDPMIQVAALADNVELPDMSLATLERVDVCAVAASFASWWQSNSNVYRHEFLNQELTEAATDESMRDALAVNDTEDRRCFRETYFQAHRTREKVMAQKLAHVQRLNRIDAIFQHGKQAAPILLEASQSVLLVPFSFPVVPVVRPVTPEAPVILEDAHENQCVTFEEVSATEEITSTDLGDQPDRTWSQRDELAQMAMEDALSRELNDGYESASDDDDQDVGSMSIEPPKRTDFTNSYFFGNLPKAYRVNGGGWVAGSGIDNGDEEIEEEERLERERQHQEMLDRLEADRIAELERQAELMRVKKEMDEKALQMKRLRQLELRKLLVYQAEVEARRREQDEHKALLRERVQMEAEERSMRTWLEHLGSERHGMILEDQRAARNALAVRNAKRDEMRRVLAEMTQMDAEDHLSALAQAEQLALERQQRLRVEYLTELYEPFEPFFLESKMPSEEMLPVITRRPKRSPKSRKPGYALPMAEVLALGEDVEQEHYAVRDSRKLRHLMGLPTSTQNSRRTMRIPSEHEIISTRRELQLMLPPTRDCVEEDRLDSSVTTHGLDFAHARKMLVSNQGDRATTRARLPELVQWKTHHDQRLTDLTSTQSPGSPNQHTHTGNSKAKPVEELARQQTALPFFRGNFGIQGTRPRSQAYSIPK